MSDPRFSFPLRCADALMGVMKLSVMSDLGQISQYRIIPIISCPANVLFVAPRDVRTRGLLRNWDLMRATFNVSDAPDIQTRIVNNNLLVSDA